MDPGRHLDRLWPRDVCLLLADQDAWTEHVTVPEPGPWVRHGGRLRAEVLPEHGHHQSLELARQVRDWFRSAPTHR